MRKRYFLKTLCLICYLSDFHWFFIPLQSTSISLDKRIYIDKLAFHGLTNLDTLKIIHTELTSPPSLFSIQQYLTFVEFTKNKLTSIPSNYFSGCTKLTVLKLSHIRLTALPDLSTASDTSVFIDLDFNDLIDISSLQDVTFPRLEYLRFRNNKIQHVNVKRLH